MTMTNNSMKEEELQKIMTEIVAGFRNKFLGPLREENTKLAEMLELIHTREQQELTDIKNRLDQLEEIIKESPLLILTAIKEAINQVGMGAQE